MLPVVAGAAVFLAFALGLLGLLGSRGAFTDTERRVLALGAAPEAGAGGAILPVFRRPTSSVPIVERFLARSTWAERTARDLEQGGIRLRLGEYLAMRLLIAVAAFTVVALLSRMSTAGVVIALLAGLAGFLLPRFWVGMRRRHRIEAINKQLPEFLVLLGNSLRAGFAFLQSVETASHQVDPPLSEELEIFLADTALGASTEDALRELGERSGSYDLDLVVTAILVQRATGGNLAELLGNVAETMRERERIHGEIRTFTSQQRFTGNILAVYPAAIALLFTALAPSMWLILWTDHLGQVLLGIAAGLQVLGIILIRRLLEIDY